MSDDTPSLDLMQVYLYCTLADEFPAQHVGRPQLATDVELVCLAIGGVLLNVTSERAWLRRVEARLGHLFPRIPKLSSYNKRLRKLGPLLSRALEILRAAYPETREALLLVDTTPVPCAQSLTTVQHSRLGPGVVSSEQRKRIRTQNPGIWAASGYSAAHKRRYWGFKLAYLATPSGFPLAHRLLSANLSEQDALRALLATTDVSGRTLVGDKGFRGRDLEAEVNAAGAHLIRPDRRNEPPRHGKGLKVRQQIEACFATLKGQLGLERHGARTRASLEVRIATRLLALAAALWLNQLLGRPGRHLIAYDH